MAIGEFFKGVCPAAFRAYVSRNFGLFIVVSTTMILSAEFEMALSQIWWRNIMFRQTLGWIAGGLLILTGAFGGTALAVPNSAANGIRAASATLGPVEKTQYYVDDYYWDGYYWCWYEFGWHGPGWYVCDYGPWVTGYWWGGGFGWHHWRWHGPRLHGAYHHHGKQRPELYHGRKPGTKGYKGTPRPGMKESKGTQHPGTKGYKGTQVYRGSNVAHGPTHTAPSHAPSFQSYGPGVRSGGGSAPSFRSGGGGGGGAPSCRSGGGGGGGAPSFRSGGGGGGGGGGKGHH